jgi:predicted anti-sigma-YlaC factor YlaD
MFTRHVSRLLAAHIDGELSPQKAGQVEQHQAHCAECRAKREQVGFGMELLDLLPPVEPPDAIWMSIEEEFQKNLPAKRSAAWRLEYHPWRWAFAATAILALAGAAYFAAARHAGTRWEVVRVDGSPVVNQKRIRGVGRIGAGEWIETDSGSSATVKVGEIGSVEVGPNTRLRIVTARPGEHRLALARGGIRARISAPPRLFFVDTASGTAVDLGCEYTLDADENGSGLLRVTKGWVSFQWKGRESLVPAGASCRTHPGVGPGIPYFDDAPEIFKQALEAFGSARAAVGSEKAAFGKKAGFDQPGYDALSIVLTEARVRDTLTLWHLLSRVELEDRARVYDRIASLTPVPPTVSREQALKLDPETLRRWKDELAWTW